MLYALCSKSPAVAKAVVDCRLAAVVVAGCAYALMTAVILVDDRFGNSFCSHAASSVSLVRGTGGTKRAPSSALFWIRYVSIDVLVNNNNNAGTAVGRCIRK